MIVVNDKSLRLDAKNSGDLANEKSDGNVAPDVLADKGNDLKPIDLAPNDIAIKDGRILPGAWASISAGNFVMGASAGEACNYDGNTQRQVTLTHSFKIQTTEVTQAQFQSLMGYNPSYFTACGINCPVEEVNWHEATAYCNALSTQAGYDKCFNCSGSGTSVSCSPNTNYSGSALYNCPGYRLPTEAEWEYAYRAGTTTSLYNNTSVINCTSRDDNANAISWNAYNSQSSTHPVGEKIANNWGLFDMAGNVYEWTNGWFLTNYGTASATDPLEGPDSFHVIRGGDYSSNPTFVLAATRVGYTPAEKNKFLGFRCLKTN